MFDQATEFGLLDPAHSSHVAPHLPQRGSLTERDTVVVNRTTPSITTDQLFDLAVQTLNYDEAAAAEWASRAFALLRARHCRTNAGDDAASLPRGGLAPWQIKKVVNYVDEMLGSTIRTCDCAKIARLSTSHFSRAFKVSFEETFFRFVIRRRTERAQELMILTDDPLCQIALNCGFADQSHLSRLFRRLVGVSPAVWRRRRRERPFPN